MPSSDGALSPSQAAARIGASTRTVQRWIATGRLPARRVGGRWRIDPGDLAVVAGAAPDAVVASTTPRSVGVSAGEPAVGRTDAPPPGRSVPIRRLFIANRGEIARRIARTCERLAIAWVRPPTEGPGAVDLLDPEAVVRAALAAGADALHPGYGFLAEQADFAELVVRSGLRWIGPPPEAIRALGDKAAARRLAASLGIPVVPGYDGPDQSDDRLAAEAHRIGPPVLVKPAGGGGGKGMRIVRDLGRLGDALAVARREALAAFADDRLVLERYVEGARHVEIQVLADARGRAVHLGERDCSIQRRHQKILEETPSPAVDEALRARLGDAALRLASAVGYVSAGTCEFLLDDRGAHYFLEMNTRLQVEHPVTEAVTGRDLVADQIRIAAGEPLGLRQADVRLVGHAVEVRLYAEDAEADFLPATGRVLRLRWPTGPGIRVDAGIDEGDEVGGRFDPLLAKIVAHAADRSQALDRLAEALDETIVLGLVTNLRFLRWLVRSDPVRRGEARTDTLERSWPPDDWAARTAIPDEVWRLASEALVEAQSDRDPWSGGWRLNAPARLRLVADGQERSVDVDSRPPVQPEGTGAALASSGGASSGRDSVAGSGASPALPSPGGGAARGSRTSPALVLAADGVHVDVAGRDVVFGLAPPPDVERAARAVLAGGAAGGGIADVTAPMPGVVLAIHVEPGATVGPGDPILTLEAMKMEHVVAAPGPGRVVELRVRPGDQVTRGQLVAVVGA